MLCRPPPPAPPWQIGRTDSEVGSALPVEAYGACWPQSMNPSVGSTRSCGGSGQVGRGMAGTGFSQLLPCFTSPHSALPRKRGRECESPVRRREARASVSAWWYEISANSLKFLQVLHSDVTLVVFPHRSGGWLWILGTGNVPGNARLCAGRPWPVDVKNERRHFS